MRIPPRARPAPQAPSATRDGDTAVPGLPGHIVDDFTPHGTGSVHCPRCGGPARYVVQPMVFALPGAGFSLIGRGGVCLECDTIVAMRQVSFDAIVAAWTSRPPGADRLALLIHRPGESDASFRRRVAASLTPLDQATAATLGAFSPPEAVEHDVGIAPITPATWEPGTSRPGIFGWLRGTRQ